MVWAGIRHDRRTVLVSVNGALHAQIYRDEILQLLVVSLINVAGGICQHDSGQATHCTSLSRLSTANHRSCLTAISADLYPRKQLWDILDRRVRQRNSPPQTPQELFWDLQNEWQNIHQSTNQNNIVSVRRCWAPFLEWVKCVYARVCVHVCEYFPNSQID